MEHHNKRRALIVVGAGASVEYGIPATASFGAIIDAAVRADLFCQRSGGTEAYFDVQQKLATYYQSEGEAHFERIYHVLHELDTLDVTPGAVAKFKPVMLPFLEIKKAYEQHALRAAAGTMLKCIYGTVSTACNAPRLPLDTLTAFFDQLRAEYLPRVYTTNYDDFVGQATNDHYFTGFTLEHGDHWDFDGAAFWSHWDEPGLFHLHGSVHMGFPKGTDRHDIGDIAWYTSRDKASENSSFGGSDDPRMDGTQIARSAIITGLDKLGRLQRTPYAFYYSGLARDAMEADVIFVIGSGLADLHLNTWLKAVRRAKPNVPILYVGYWGGALEGFHNSLHFAYQEREISLLHDLRINLYGLPIDALKATDGWTVDVSGTAAVWADGFQSFLREPNALRKAMRAIGA